MRIAALERKTREEQREELIKLLTQSFFNVEATAGVLGTHKVAIYRACWRLGVELKRERKKFFADEMNNVIPPPVTDLVPVTPLPARQLLESTAPLAGIRSSPKVSPAVYERLFRTQHGVCAICNRPENAVDSSGAPARMNYYFNFRDGIVRGLLCKLCNLGLQMFNDDPGLIAKALTFITSGENSSARVLTR